MIAAVLSLQIVLRGLRPRQLLGNTSMQRRAAGSWVFAAVCAVACTAAAAQAPDAMRGRLYYVDTARLAATRDNCVNCHALPPDSRASAGANSPTTILSAMAGDLGPGMSQFLGRLTTRDVADIAAFLGQQNVPFPQPAAAAFESFSAGVGMGGQMRLVELRNTGNAPVQWDGAARIDGVHAGDFSIGANTCAVSLAPGASCTVDVRFMPRVAAADISALLVVPHTWVGGQSVVRLQAAATGPLPAVRTTADVVDFGSVAVGVESEQRLSLRNIGSGATLLRSIDVAAPFRVARGQGINCAAGELLAPGAVCEVVLRFAPLQAGPASGELRIAASAVAPVAVPVAGSGAGAVSTPAPSSAAGGAAAPMLAALFALLLRRERRNGRR